MGGGGGKSGSKDSFKHSEWRSENSKKRQKWYVPAWHTLHDNLNIVIFFMKQFIQFLVGNKKIKILAFTRPYKKFQMFKVKKIKT